MNKKNPSPTQKLVVVGLGYVGLPLALQFADAGTEVLGLDIDPQKVEKLRRGESYLMHIDGDRIGRLVRSGGLTASSDFSLIAKKEAVVICVPTPLNKNREPDISYILKTGEAIAPHLGERPADRSRRADGEKNWSSSNPPRTRALPTRSCAKFWKTEAD